MNLQRRDFLSASAAGVLGGAVVLAPGSAVPDLEYWTGKNGGKYNLERPFVQGGWVYAASHFAAVRMHASLTDGIEYESGADMPQANAFFWQAFNQPLPFVDDPGREVAGANVQCDECVKGWTQFGCRKCADTNGVEFAGVTLQPYFAKELRRLNASVCNLAKVDHFPQIVRFRKAHGLNESNLQCLAFRAEGVEGLVMGVA